MTGGPTKILLLIRSNTHTPIVLPQSLCAIEFLENSHISEPFLELHSRPALSVGGITAQSVQPQGEIPEEGRTEKKVKLKKGKRRHSFFVNAKQGDAKRQKCQSLNVMNDNMGHSKLKQNLLKAG